MTRRASTILAIAVIVSLAGCGDSQSAVTAPEGKPSFAGGILAGSGNRSDDGGATTASDSTASRGGLLAGSGN